MATTNWPTVNFLAGMAMDIAGGSSTVWTCVSGSSSIASLHMLTAFPPFAHAASHGGGCVIVLV